jgi:hypothetical protein
LRPGLAERDFPRPASADQRQMSERPEERPGAGGDDV